MYQLIPYIFYVPVFYEKDDIFNINTALSHEHFSDNYSINEFTMRKKLVVGISLPTLRESRWIRDKETMENYAKEKGINVKIQNADTDEVKQASQVDNMISQGIDTLILAPVNSETASSIIQKAHDAGIKVIIYERFVKNGNEDLFVSFNSTVVGELQGRYLTRHVPRGNYIIMSGDPKDRNSKFYKDGAMEFIQPLADKGDIKIITDKAVENWDPKNAYKIVQDALIANNNKIDAILAPNDAVAGAAIDALKTKGLAGKVVVTGQDADLAAVRRIIQGTQAMTVFKDTRQLSKVAIESAINLANKKPTEINGLAVDMSSILLTPIIVDKFNLSKVLVGSGYYTPAELFKP
ncbi:MAG: substrate-binding domain-containing protein [Clostridiaceae bacterium]